MKKVVGIFAIVFSCIVLFQSCAVGIGTTMTGNLSDNSGAIGMVVGVFMIIGGILSIISKNSLGITITAAVLFFTSFLLAYSSSGMFSDLQIWKYVNLFLGAFIMDDIYRNKKTKYASNKTNTLYCKNCGTPYNYGEKFCNNCGNKLM